MKARLGWSLLVMATMGAAGCEALIPLAISEGAKGDVSDVDAGAVASEEAELTVELESLSGEIGGDTLSAARVDELIGRRFQETLHFEFNSQEDGLTMSLELGATDTSGVNPYTGENGGLGGLEGLAGGEAHPGAEPPVIDAGAGFGEPPMSGFGGTPTGSGSAAFLFACARTDGCHAAQELALEVTQTEDGRRAVVDGTFGEHGRLTTVFRYREEP